MKTLLGFLVVWLAAVTTTHAQWIRCNGYSESDVRSVAVSGNLLFIATSESGVLRSADNGGSWTAVNSGLPKLMVTSFAVTQTAVYVGSDNGVFRSSDNGDTWIPVNSGLKNKNVLSLIAGGVTLFAGTAHGGIFRSTDNGESWTAANSGLNSRYIHSLVATGSAIFAGGAGIYRSTDNGESWHSAVYEFPSHTFVALAVLGSVLYAGTDGIGVFRSTDNGDNWSKVNSGLPDRAVMSLVVNNNTVFVGTISGIYSSSDNGDHWTEVNTGLKNKYIRSLAGDGTLLFAGTGGYGIWKLDVGTLDVGASAVREPLDVLRLHCYPNPAVNTITIDRTGLPFSEVIPVTYTIVDFTGTKLMEFQQYEQQFSISIDRLVSGVYSLVAQQGSDRATVLVTVTE